VPEPNIILPTAPYSPLVARPISRQLYESPGVLVGLTLNDDFFNKPRNKLVLRRSPTQEPSSGEGTPERQRRPLNSGPDNEEFLATTYVNLRIKMREDALSDANLSEERGGQ
jgi:hypothetical protein